MVIESAVEALWGVTLEVKDKVTFKNTIPYIT